MKPCYFCHKYLNSPADPQYKGIYYCKNCAHKNNFTSVVTVYDTDEKLLYVHIYVPIKQQDYHIRMNFRDNTTDVLAPMRHCHLQKFDGHPFTLQNANSKLHTVLTFL